MERQKTSLISVSSTTLEHDDASNLAMLLRLLSTQDQHLLEITQETEAMLTAAQGLYRQTLHLKSQLTRKSVASVVLDSLYPGGQADWQLRFLEKPKKVYFKRRKFR